MADPSDQGRIDSTDFLTTTLRPNISVTSNARIGGQVPSTVHLSNATTTAATHGNDPSEGSFHDSPKDCSKVISPGKARFAKTRSTPAMSETTTLPVKTPKFPLEKLAPELRLLIYRAYFEDFVEEKSKVADIRRTAKTFLGLLHSNRTIRNEAGPIFNKEFLCVDKSTTGDNLEADMWLRIKSTCSLDESVTPSLGPIASFASAVQGYYRLTQGRFQAQLRSFVQHEEQEFYEERGIVFDPKIHKGRGFDISFLEVSGSTGVEASDTLCIEGPLAELRWPDSLDKDGREHADLEGFEVEGFEFEGFDGESFDGEEFDDEEFDDEEFDGEEFEAEFEDDDSASED